MHCGHELRRAISQASAVGHGNFTALAAAIAIANAASAGDPSILAQALLLAVAQGANASAVGKASGDHGAGRHLRRAGT